MTETVIEATPGLLRWQDVEGWLSQQEGEMLGMLAIGANVLELGTYKGRSTVCLAQFAKYVVTIDHHKGDSSTGAADTFEDLCRNLLASGLRERIRPLVRPIDESAFTNLCAPQIDPPPFDLVFIDDDHHESERSTRLAMKWLKPGGTIAWHDFNQTIVRDGIAACGLFPVNQVGSLAWMKLP